MPVLVNGKRLINGPVPHQRESKYLARYLPSPAASGESNLLTMR
jgi:hypothetical protein